MSEEHDLGKSVLILSHHMRRYLDRAAREYEITGVQGRVLHFICGHSKNGDVYQKDIEDEFHIRRSTATGILKLMEKNGFIVKETAPEDARLKRLMLTERGREYEQKMCSGILQMEEQLRAGLTGEEIAAFQRIIGKMSENLGKNDASCG